MISYAQNFEDVILYRLFRDRKDGFYVDVGAGHPIDLSVTKWFYDIGWSGINIEPHPEFYQKLITTRPRDVNLNCGAGATRSKALFFELQMKELSSFDPHVRDKAKARGETVDERTIPILPLNEILEQHQKDRAIDFLKIDVEGWEHEVLAGINLHQYRPTVIVIEATTPETHDAVFSLWEDILTGANYQPAYFDGLNKYYLQQEQIKLKKHFLVPPNIFDEFTLSGAHEWTRTLMNSDLDVAETIQILDKALERSEADRAARLHKILVLHKMLKQADADIAARRWLPGFLIEAWKKLLKTASADRV